MKLVLLYHTLRHLRLRQLVYQLWYRLYKPSYVPIEKHSLASLSRLAPFPYKAGSYDASKHSFTFISLAGEFDDWQDTSRGMLWAYNLNYMDWLLQEGLPYEEGSAWIDQFIEDLPSNKIGQDPYPTALRIVNWMKFICLHREQISEEKRTIWERAIRAQTIQLSKKLEYHLLGNHLLEDLYGLFIASIYLSDKSLNKWVTRLLLDELAEEILPDGAHYEQSPMYHAILLDRLLDCYNFAANNRERVADASSLATLERYAISMLGHLASIVYRDGSIPLVNDSAYGIAPTYAELSNYAKDLGLCWKPIPMQASGYRWLRSDSIEALIDVGNITATYQPGHTHADSLSYELRINNHPCIVDTGISTYNKTARREYERSTRAHNTVVVGNHSSSQTWGGFRVGKRAQTSILHESESMILAEHNGYGLSCIHRRQYQLEEECLRITDTIASDNAISLIHLAPGIELNQVSDTLITTSSGVIINIKGAGEVEIGEDCISRYYNLLERARVIKIHFSQKVEYIISQA